MMKFTLAWLKEHLDTDAPLAAIVDKLTMIGLEVESVADRGKMLAPFTVARVISAERHPNADRLRVCMVDTGTGDPVQVVCGAPNARAGMKGVFAAPGAFIPGNNITLGVGYVWLPAGERLDLSKQIPENEEAVQLNGIGLQVGQSRPLKLLLDRAVPAETARGGYRPVIRIRASS